MNGTGLRIRAVFGVFAVAAGLVTGAATPFAAEEHPDPFAVEYDRYSMPAEFRPNDFYSLSRLFIQPGHSMWHADNYETAELERVVLDGEEWVRWRFSKKTNEFIPSLAYRYPARVDPVRFSIRVWNRGEDPVSLSCWGETDAQNWQTVGPNEDRVVTLAGQPTLVVQSTQPGKDYDLCLRELTVFYPEASEISVKNLDVPSDLVAGEGIRIRVEAEGDLDGQALALEVRNDPWVIWRIRLSSDESEQLRSSGACTLERIVPEYLSPGAVTMGLTADGLRTSGEGRASVINTRRPGLPRIERRLHNGRPTFFCDGEPFVWSGYATYFNISPAVFNEFAESGASLFHITCAAGRHFHNVSAPTWLGGDEYDFGEVEQWATTALQANPNAKLVLRVALGLPPFWFADHPDSRVRVRTMDGRELVWNETDSAVAALTSPAWREQQAVALRELIRYVASRPWASHVVGLNLGGGMTEEWFAWASCDNIVTPVQYFSDYSPANQQAFREWCRARGYPYDEIPSPEARTRPNHDLFPDDENGRWAAAYNLFINETTAETLKYFAAVVKDETERKSLVGAFFGYVVLLTGEARQSNAGQFGLRIALESEDIDFLSGVPLFAFRHLTDVGYAGQPTAVESLLAHGKQYVDDNDLFSWLHDAHWHTLYDERDPRGAAKKMHRRWAASEAVRGNSYEWFSLSPKWHHDGPLMDEYGLEARVLADSLALDRSPVEEIAFVVDDHSFAWLTPESQAHYANQLLLGALARTGAPLGVWLLSDLDRLPERIKFVAVVNASAPRTEDLAKLQRLIAEGGRTILVVGVPGLVTEETQRWEPANIEELLGLPVRLDGEPGTGRVRLADGSWLSTMDTVMQADRDDPRNIRPRPYLEGPGFLQYEDGKTAGGERPLANGGRLIWCGVPPYASEDWLREQVLAAEVHCYAPAPCSVHASRELVAITSVYSEDREIELSWPEDVAVTDLFDGWTGRGRTIVCPFEYGQTRLFRLSKP